MSFLSKSIWGPACWTTMHAFACSVEEDSVEDFKAFLKSAMKLIPCLECRNHYADYIKKCDPEIYVIDMESASRFVFDLHNYVNARLKKISAKTRILEERWNVKLQTRGGRYSFYDLEKRARKRVLKDNDVSRFYFLLDDNNKEDEE